MTTETLEPETTSLTHLDRSRQATIGDAIEQYQMRGDNAVYPGFRELVYKMVVDGTPADFANDSYLDALFLTELMFNHSNKSIRLLTGCNSEGEFLQVLRKPFEIALERLKKVNGTAKVILLCPSAPTWLLNLKATYQGTLDIALGREVEPVKHFIVCDSTMARCEEPHGPLTPQSLASAIKAKVYFNNPDKSALLERLFDAMWNKIKSPLKGGAS